MTIIFKAKTHDAYTIKILAELLQNNLNTACFQIDKDSICLCMMDDRQTILIKVELESEKFILYKFKSPKKIFIGVNLNHFHKMLKSIKKKDSLQLFIDDDNPTDLGIKVIPKENNRITTSFIKIQEIQTLDIDIPTGYEKPVIVPSVEYQKMVKDMGHISNNIKVTSKNFYIKFVCDVGGIMTRHVEFGEMNDSDDDSDEEEDTSKEYSQNFDTEQLSRITKIAGLGTNMQIYPKEGIPLLFKSTVNSLGKISIYIKSKELIEKEEREKKERIAESDDDEY